MMKIIDGLTKLIGVVAIVILLGIGLLLLCASGKTGIKLPESKTVNVEIRDNTKIETVTTNYVDVDDEAYNIILETVFNLRQ